MDSLLHPLGFNRRYRFSESLIMENEKAYALGRFKTLRNIEQDEIVAMHRLVAPQLRNKPLLLSTLNEEQLARQFRRKALTCLCFIALAIWLCSELFSATLY